MKSSSHLSPAHSKKSSNWEWFAVRFKMRTRGEELEKLNYSLCTISIEYSSKCINNFNLLVLKSKLYQISIGLDGRKLHFAHILPVWVGHWYIVSSSDCLCLQSSCMERLAKIYFLYILCFKDCAITALSNSNTDCVLPILAINNLCSWDFNDAVAVMLQGFIIMVDFVLQSQIEEHDYGGASMPSSSPSDGVCKTLQLCLPPPATTIPLYWLPYHMCNYYENCNVTTCEKEEFQVTVINRQPLPTS